MARHVQDRAGDIVDAAYRLFAQRGFHRTGIKDIAAELGLGHGTFYRYFNNKRDIFDHVIDRVTARLMEALAHEPPTAARSLEEYRAQVQRIGLELADVFLGDPHLSRLMFIESIGVDADTRARLRVAMDGFARYTGLYLQNGIDRGFLAADLDIDITARIVNSMVLQAVQHVVDAPDPQVARDAWISAATRMIFGGIAVQSPPTPR